MIDNIILISYLFLLLIVGLWIGKSNDSFKQYGQKIGALKHSKFILLATTFATSVGGATTFGIVEKVYLENFAFTYALIISALIDIIIAHFLVPKLLEHRESMTVADIFSKYYGNFGKILIGISTVIICIGYLSVQISVSSKIFQYFFNIPTLFSVIFSYVIVITYTSFGGIKSVVFTDLIQFTLMVTSIPLALIIAIYNIGGVDSFISQIPVAKYNIANKELYETFICASLCFCFTGLNPTNIQRAILSKDYKITQQAIYRKSIIYVAFILVISLLGCAVFIHDNTIAHQLALSHFIDDIIPIGVKGFVMIGFISAAISTADSDLNLATISIVNDILKPMLSITNQETKLKLAKIIAILLGVIAIYISLVFPSIIDIVLFFANFWSPIAFVPLIFILYKKSLTKSQFFVSTIISASVTFYLEYYHSSAFVPSMFIGVLCSFIAHIFFRSILFPTTNQ